MARVTGTFPDYSRHNNRGSFVLESDKEFNPFTWAPPINWTGYINDVKVSFVQVNASGSMEMDYDFSNCSSIIESAKSYIIEAIDDAMRVMD